MAVACDAYPVQRQDRAFTFLEILLVISIMVFVAVMLIPALSPGAARTLDAASRQFAADVENARLIAVAERTRTRVLIPTNINNFAAVAGATPWPSDVALRGYVVASENRVESRWRQRGKWNKFPSGVAFDSTSGVFPQPSPIPAATPPIPIDSSGSGSTTTYTYNGPYIEFLPNGASNLNPVASPAQAGVIADGFVDSSGNFAPKNRGLRMTATIDPLTGSLWLR